MSDELISRLRDRSISIAAKDRDWPTFWQSLTAQETAAALRAAPKVAGEWRDVPGGARRDVSGGAYAPFIAVAVPAQGRRDFQWAAYIGVGVFGFADSLDAAKSAADAALRAAGWVLL